MTNQEKLELIAQARESLAKQKTEIQSWLDDTDEIWTSQEAKDRAVNHLRAVDTHLAEMDEHGETCGEMGMGDAHKPMCMYDETDYPCDFLLTKAKRLLGVE